MKYADLFFGAYFIVLIGACLLGIELFFRSNDLLLQIAGVWVFWLIVGSVFLIHPIASRLVYLDQQRDKDRQKLLMQIFGEEPSTKAKQFVHCPVCGEFILSASGCEHCAARLEDERNEDLAMDEFWPNND